ncbi:MAG: hypothetical protein H7Z10_06865, partial [Gemmatimonadaceae bacterium]|nr:hypothetical protein [Acetobacteraceae bacterium]
MLTALYDAVLDPALWPDAWAQATAAGGSAPMVVVADGGTPLPLAASGWNRHTVVTGMGGPPRPAPAEAGALDRSGTIRLNQHLRRAIRLRARLAAAQTVQAASAAALQAADTGVVLLSSGGRLMHADATALRLSGSVGLQLHARSGGVTTPDPAATNYLHTLLHDAAAGGSGGDMLMRGADGSAVAVAVCPLPRPETEAPNGSATPVMLTLRRLVQAPVCPRRLSALFGLTRA